MCNITGPRTGSGPVRPWTGPRTAPRTGVMCKLTGPHGPVHEPVHESPHEPAHTPVPKQVRSLCPASQPNICDHRRKYPVTPFMKCKGDGKSSQLQPPWSQHEATGGSLMTAAFDLPTQGVQILSFCPFDFLSAAGIEDSRP